MNIEQLQAQVKAAQEANAVRIAEAAQVAQLEAALKLESSESLFNAKVKLALSGSVTKRLTDIVEECVAIIDGLPVVNNKTRANRKWAGSNRFIFGTQVNLMYQLATGIQFSCAEHKPLLLAHTGLDAELLEQLVDAFGTPAYYSRNYNTIVEAKPYDVESVLMALNVMQSQLNITVDMSNVTPANFSLEFGRAETRAYSDKIAAEEAIAELDMAV